MNCGYPSLWSSDSIFAPRRSGLVEISSSRVQVTCPEHNLRLKAEFAVFFSQKLPLWKNYCNKSLWVCGSRASLKPLNLNTPEGEGARSIWSPRWNTPRWWAEVEELKVIRSNGRGWGRAVVGGLNAASVKPLMSAVMRVSWDWSWSLSRLASDWF